MASISIDYVVFKPVTGIKEIAYFHTSTIEGSPSGMVQLVQERARRSAEKDMEDEDRGVIAVDVYEV